MEDQPISPVQQPVPPVQSYAPQPMPPVRSHGPVIAAIVVGVLVLAGAVFAYTKLANKPAETASPTPSVSASGTPISTAGWKTYTDTEVGFTLKYPPQVTASSVDRPIGWPVKILAYVAFTVQVGHDSVQLFVVPQEDWQKPGGEGYIDFFQVFTNPSTGAKMYVSAYATSETSAQWVPQMFATLAFTATASPTPTSTAGWKTYTNTQYAFAVQYPALWEVAPVMGKPALGVAYARLDLKTDATVGVDLIIDTSTSDAKTWFWNKLSPSPAQVSEEKQYTLNGSMAYCAKITVTNAYIDKHCVVARNGTVVDLSFRAWEHGTNLNGTGTPWTVDHTQYIPDFDQIVSTFTFTSPAEAALQVGSLKTYQGINNSYSFDYPSNWVVSCNGFLCDISNYAPQGKLQDNPQLCYLDINNVRGGATFQKVDTYKTAANINLCNATLDKIQASFRAEPM